MVSIVFAVLYGMLAAAKAYFARRFIRHFVARSYQGGLHDVAVLQPILSGDPLLEQTLRTSLRLLPQAHFYWLTDTADAQAQTITVALKQQHPVLNIHLLQYEQAPAGINPKMFKLAAVLPLCQQPYLLVLDDDTSITSNSLRAMLGELDQHTIATGLPYYHHGNTGYSALLASFVNNNAATTYLATLPFMAPVTINGMCYAIKRDTLLALGGFAPVLHHLTDDLAVAELVLAGGGSIAQLPQQQQIQTHLATARAYWQQMHRWYLFAKLLFARKPRHIQAIMALLYGLPPLLCWLMLLALLWQPSLAALLTCAGALTLKLWLTRQLNGAVPGQQAGSVLLALLSEYLQLLHVVHALCSKRIRWRSRYYRVYASDKFEPLKP
ncbi:glycosyltransferase family 2 protein [Rheinheimera hassiensis]|uniref:glycosyltransferase family 2 protein n=1 Tax=Rheinheimera hassiensis TaxID=1193627 RepID=UPI001F06154D|nr:glycosyltransferase [Rheinheimera hassiensis]